MIAKRGYQLCLAACRSLGKRDHCLFAAIGASSALCSALPWIFNASSKTFYVVDEELEAKDLLALLQKHPDIEELNLEKMESLKGSNQEKIPLFEYLSNSPRLQRIRGADALNPDNIFPGFDYKNPSESVKNFCKKLTDFPNNWLLYQPELAELKAWLALMPNLSVVNFSKQSIKKAAGLELVKNLYGRSTPPAFLLFKSTLVAKIIDSYKDTPPQKGSPEAKFLASLLELPEEIEADAQTLKKILPFCNNLRALDLTTTPWDLDLAKAIALFDPQQLTLSLCGREESKILSAL
ncbi:MAG: hypothetical protein JSR80_07035, partial [Verrucomicrobia bacterium]|nr:hypothetical protein [Verrucomicrobiota bacterium]